MSDDLDLKPCPLCGRSPQLATSFGEPVVGCVNRSCDLCDTEWFDVDAWNGRPVEDALRARDGKAEAALAAAIAVIEDNLRFAYTSEAVARIAAAEAATTGDTESAADLTRRADRYATLHSTLHSLRGQIDAAITKAAKEPTT